MPSPRVYSRSPYILPQQGDDIFEPVYNQPSQMVPVEYGSSAGGQAVLQGQSYANPGYGPSRLDRYAGDEKGYGNGALGYEDGLQLDQQGISQYYDAVNRMNDLSLKAENLGFNIKKPHFQDKLQQQMYQEYLQHQQDAQTRVMTLKRGRELQNEVQKGIIEGRVYTPNNQHFRNQGTFTDADFANSTNRVDDPTSAAFNQYNAKTYNDPAAEALARKRRTGLVGVEQQIIDQSDAVLADPNATFEQRDKAINDKFKAEQDQLRYAQPTLDRNEAQNRAQRERLAKDKDDDGGNELLLRGLFQLHNNNFEYDTDGVLKNKDFTGAKLNVGNAKADVQYITKNPKTGLLEAVVTTTKEETDKTTGKKTIQYVDLTVPIGNLKQLGLRLKEDNKETYGSKKSFGEAIRGYESPNNEIDFNRLFPQNALSDEQKSALNQQAQQSARLPEESGTPEVLNNMLENTLFGKQRQDVLNQQYNETKRQALGQTSVSPLKSEYSIKGKKYSVSDLNKMGYSEEQIRRAITLGTIK